MTILHICILASNYKLSSEVKGQSFLPVQFSTHFRLYRINSKYLTEFVERFTHLQYSPCYLYIFTL